MLYIDYLNNTYFPWHLIPFTMSLNAIKEKIHEHCKHYIQKRMETALQAIAAVQAAGEEETKSSAGDKYETGREMMKQEIERHQQLLAEAQGMEAALEKFSPPSNPTPEPQKTIRAGSLVQTDQGIFYLAIGIGKLIVEGTEAFVLSPSAPVGRLLIGKRIGDTVSFNGKTYSILAVE